MKEDNSLLLLPEWNLTLEFDVIPQIRQPFSLIEALKDGSTETAVYHADGYRLTVVKGEFRGSRTIDFFLKRVDGCKFTTNCYRIRCIVPVIDMYNVSPRAVGYAFTQHRNPDLFRTSCTTKDAPFVMYAGSSGENRFTIGLDRQYMETDIFRGRVEKLGYLHYNKNIISFERPVSGVTLRKEEIADGIFISTKKTDWFHVSKDYWDYIDERRHYIPNPTPVSAYGPLWCSWLYQTDIDEKKIWENAFKAKELGIKTLMIDAGWFCSDTDIPFPHSPLTDDTFGFGRIDADKNKFPDMKGLVERIHDMGLYVWAWCTPRWTFRAIEEGEGKVDSKLLDCRIEDKNGIKQPLLCTRHPQTREHAARFTARLLEKYGFDGLKFDCWELDEGMEVCYSDHEHDCDTMGEGTLLWGKAIYEAMTAVKQDAVVWLNNTVMKPYGNYSCSPNEVYCQPDENWRLSPLVKSFASGIVSHLSEGAWHPSEPDQSLARQLAILMMGHVPEFQVDLTALSPGHECVMKAYLSFYEKHKKQLLFGEYTPWGFEHMVGGPVSSTPPHVKIEAEDEAFLFIGAVYCEKVRLEKAPENCYLFNLKNIDGLRLMIEGMEEGEKTIRTFDCYGNVVSRQNVWCGKELLLDSGAGYGCMVSIETA